jgi:methionyl aminopeptidase
MKEQYKQDFLRAGAIAKEVRAFGKALIKPGASYNAVRAQIVLKIAELGAKPAFPPQIALNDVAAHFLTQPGTDLLFSDQVVKLDVGVCFNGAIGDCAVTIDLSGKYASLIEAAENALFNAEKSIKVGLPIREIGKIIESTICSYGLEPIRNLCGHGLGHFQIHTAPSIPNCDDKSKGVIKPGMTFAIEPFATNGKGWIYESNHPTIFSFLKSVPLTTGPAKKILAKIQTFQGLPFSMHELLTQEISFIEVKLALNELMALGAIAGYPPLIEESHGMVAQAENSILVDENGKVFVTTR